MSMKTDDLANYMGLLPMADPTIALDFLLTTKNGVRNAAIALTEAGTPEVRTVIRAQLEQGIEMHEKISQLMISKGWLRTYNVNEQFQLDLQMAQMTLQLADLNLFPPKINPSAKPQQSQSQQ